MGLHDDACATHGARLRRASGPCPYTGTLVESASLPVEGVLFRAEWTLPVTAIEAPPPIVPRAPAWVIHDDELEAECLVRRLQRQGWSTTRFDSVLPARRRLRALELDAVQARPALIVALESATVSPAAVQDLRALVPASAQLVYGVLQGSPSLRAGAAAAGLEVCTQPFSPNDLARFAAHALGGNAPRARTPGA